MKELTETAKITLQQRPSPFTAISLCLTLQKVSTKNSKNNRTIRLKKISNIKLLLHHLRYLHCDAQVPRITLIFDNFIANKL